MNSVLERVSILSRRWGATALLPGLLLSQAARAQETEPPAEAAPAEAAPAEAAPAEAVAPEDPAGAEIIVWGERLASARDGLDMGLRAYGYKRVGERRGWTVYRRTGRSRWKPRVLINDDGLLVFRDTVVVVGSPVLVGKSAETTETSPGLGKSPSGMPDRGGLYLEAPIRFPSRRLQDQEKGRVLEVVQPLVDQVQRASSAVAEAEALTSLSGRLEALWREGRDPTLDAPLATPEQRRAALVQLWASRTDNSAGLQAREIIALFIEEVVQSSATPFTEPERAAAAASGLMISP